MEYILFRNVKLFFKWNVIGTIEHEYHDVWYNFLMPGGTFYWHVLAIIPARKVIAYIIKCEMK